jgi:hypothetical protein
MELLLHQAFLVDAMLQDVILHRPSLQGLVDELGQLLIQLLLVLQHALTLLSH